jgi:hypothetical protein
MSRNRFGVSSIGGRGFLAERRNELSLSALLLTWSVGTGLLICALLIPSFRDSEGNLQSNILVILATSVALITIGWAVYKEWHSLLFGLL